MRLCLWFLSLVALASLCWLAIVGTVLSFLSPNVPWWVGVCYAAMNFSCGACFTEVSLNPPSTWRRA